MTTTCGTSARRSGRASSLPPFYYTLDVLTDGSEHTGHGTIFLSVWKRPKFHNNNNNQQQQQQEPQREKGDGYDSSLPSSSMMLDIMSTSNPVARYAITGLGDATARLCADQRLKLASTRALFVPSYNQCHYPAREDYLKKNHSTGSSGNIAANGGSSSAGDHKDLGKTISSLCWEGLSALLLALHTAGAASLHIVTPSITSVNATDGNGTDDNPNNQTHGDIEDDDDVDDPLEEIATIILGRHKDLKICTCQIPIGTSSSSSSKQGSQSRRNIRNCITTNWWKVYNDEYLVVHATTLLTTISATKTTEEQVPTTVYLYSIVLDGSAGSEARGLSEPCWYTIAVFPPLCQDISELYSRLGDFPILDCHQKDGSASVTASIDCIIALNPICPPREPPLPQQDDHQGSPSTRKESKHTELPPVLATLPGRQGWLRDCDENPTIFNKDSPLDGDLPTAHQHEHQETSQDPGILIRSQQVASDFHNTLPWAFPFGGGDSKTRNIIHKNLMSANDSHSSNHEYGDDSCHSPTWTRLRSCSSILLVDTMASPGDRRQSANGEKAHFIVVDRKAEIWDRPKRHSWSNTKDSLQALVSTQSPVVSPSVDVEDENEIDLDEDDDEVDEDGGETKSSVTSKDAEQDVTAPNMKATTGLEEPHLLVLGTGCASPSAIRGASGYALIYPNTIHESHGCKQVLLLDCGEGVTTMLSRHTGGGNQFMKMLSSHITGIWISHAHLDHYGGLPTLIRAIHDAKQRQLSESYCQGGKTICEPQPAKRARLAVSSLYSTSSIPWVMAPPKVLRYLDVILHCKNGVRVECNRQLFVPMTHNNHRENPSCANLNTATRPGNLPSNPAGPWTWFQNIPVQHSCGPSYGILLAWEKQQRHQMTSDKSSPRQSRTQWLCFSGDTRPCRALVQAFHNAFDIVNGLSQRRQYAVNAYHSLHQQHHDFFLLHEATFQDDEKDQAIKKKHSTVSEAIMVARDLASAINGHSQGLANFPQSEPARTTIRILLSHFSNRYDDLELPATNTRTSCERIEALGKPTNDSNDNSCSDVDNKNKRFATATHGANCQEQQLVVGLAMDGLWVKL